MHPYSHILIRCRLRMSLGSNSAPNPTSQSGEQLHLPSSFTPQPPCPVLQHYTRVSVLEENEWLLIATMEYLPSLQQEFDELKPSLFGKRPESHQRNASITTSYKASDNSTN